MTDPTTLLALAERCRAALDKAAEATCPTARTIHGPCAPTCIHCPRIAANAIAAFLRALPTTDPTFFAQLHALAEAVLAAAKEERE